jgi:hypothetical protein
VREGRAEGFSPLAREGLGWYVYVLRDPRDGRVFYVGKGRGNRAFQHAASAADGVDHPELQSAKAARINQIIEAGHAVEVVVLRHGIRDEVQAYEVESAAIDLANMLAPGSLLNAVRGHHQVERGVMTAEEIEVLYAAPEAPQLTLPVILVSLNRLWHPDATEGELADMTQGWWHTRGPRRDRARYVFSVHNGVVRTIYRPENWRPRAAGDPDAEDDVGKPQRWSFDPVPAPEMAHFLRTSVARFLTSRQWSHRYVGPETTTPKLQ